MDPSQENMLYMLARLPSLCPPTVGALAQRSSDYSTWSRASDGGGIGFDPQRWP